MIFYTYSIKSARLKPLIQYILFNYNQADSDYSKTITSFPNTNICLGIIKQKCLVEREDGSKTFETHCGLSSYVSGIYIRPFKFEASGIHDEICIDFTPLGFEQFFSFGARPLINKVDVLAIAFGNPGVQFFSKVFLCSDLEERGTMIEAFLLRYLKESTASLVTNAVNFISTTNGDLRVNELSERLNCSSRTLQRTFIDALGVTPGHYIRISRMRRAIALLSIPGNTLAISAALAGYHDASHLSNDIHFFCDRPPRSLCKSLLNIDYKVWVAIQ